MNAFARSLDRLFAHRDLARDAVYRSGGVGEAVPCRVLLRQPDETTSFGETHIVRGTVLLDVRLADVPSLREGDTFALGDAVLTVSGAPRRDAERLTWTCGCRERVTE